MCKVIYWFYKELAHNLYTTIRAFFFIKGISLINSIYFIENQAFEIIILFLVLFLFFYQLALVNITSLYF